MANLTKALVVEKLSVSNLLHDQNRRSAVLAATRTDTPSKRVCTASWWKITMQGTIWKRLCCRLAPLWWRQMKVRLILMVQKKSSSSTFGQG